MADAKCPQCSKAVPVYDGVNPNKFATAFCHGRFAVPKPAERTKEQPVEAAVQPAPEQPAESALPRRERKEQSPSP